MFFVKNMSVISILQQAPVCEMVESCKLIHKFDDFSVFCTADGQLCFSDQQGVYFPNVKTGNDKIVIFPEGVFAHFDESDMYFYRFVDGKLVTQLNYEFESIEKNDELYFTLDCYESGTVTAFRAPKVDGKYIAKEIWTQQMDEEN